MWLERPIRGGSLPTNTLALTFDDGPGPHTIEIAHYLAEAGIPAAFFLVGENIRRFPGSVQQLLDLGHITGNHTFHHFHLTNSHSSAGDIVREIEMTDAELRTAGASVREPLLFRPPYGAWSSRLAHLLNTSSESCQNYLGPINWDLGGVDFDFWKAGKTPERCARSYLQAVTGIKSKRGIVLCHDHTADEANKSYRNRTFEMIRCLVPMLRGDGFEFRRLDSVPSIRRAMLAPLPFD